MHPFDLKTLFLAKHAQHVVLIHFPIALYMIAVLFDVLSLGKKQSTLSSASYYNLVVSALSTIPVLATGILAWHFALEGQRLKGLLLQHLVLGSTSSLFIALTWWLHRRWRRAPAEFLPLWRLPVEVLTVGLLALTGHLGGFLSGVNA